MFCDGRIRHRVEHTAFITCGSEGEHRPWRAVRHPSERVLERTSYRIGVEVGGLGGRLRKQRFSLNWLLSESKDSSITGSLSKTYL